MKSPAIKYKLDAEVRLIAVAMLICLCALFLTGVDDAIRAREAAHALASYCASAHAIETLCEGK